MEQDIPQSPISLYIHIPFCLSKCGYCSFFSVPYSRDKLAYYASILLQEKQLYTDILRRSLCSLYLGGGTPSLLSPEQINSLCYGLHLIPNAEITLEINPLQITPEFLNSLQQTPVNRLSIGLQSMLDSELRWLGRRHTSAQIASRITLCREFGYDNLSLDLMYGLPHSTTDSVTASLDEYMKLQPRHISCYLLSLDEDCALYPSASSLPDEDAAASQYELITHTLKQNGFTHYEISNFALPGYESRHNLAYWQSADYLALGASAAGFVDGIRYCNDADINTYKQMVLSDTRFPNKEDSDALRQREDYLMMGLRLIKGIDVADFKNRFGVDLLGIYGTRIDKLTSQHMLTLHEGRLCLTPQALFVSNAVIGELIL